MTKTQAEVCPGIVWRQRSLSQESTAHSALLDCAWTISPRVEGSGQEELPDTVVVDIAGCEKLLGSPEKIAGDLQRVAAAVGFDANVAVAANAESAICAARGFPGITIIPAGDEGRTYRYPSALLAQDPHGAAGYFGALGHSYLRRVCGSPRNRRGRAGWTGRKALAARCAGRRRETTAAKRPSASVCRMPGPGIPRRIA